MARDKVAYVIVSWNNKDLMDECIESIRKQDYKRRSIILVDNNSSDGTVEFMKKKFPEVEVIAEDVNHAFAKGNNIGINKAMQDNEVGYIVLLNTDARLDCAWTSTLIEAAKRRPRTATMQSITLDYFNHNIIDSTHIYVSRLGQATQGSFGDSIDNDRSSIAPYKVFGCNAAAMLITREFIEAQPFDDFFDSTMFMYLEDVDVAARATVMGWDNYVIPGVRAYHMGSVSSKKKDPSFSLYMTFRNNLGLMIKNMPFGLLVRMLLVLPRSDRASIMHLRRIGKGTAAKAIIKGRIASLRFIPVFVWKRYKLKKYVNVDEQYLWQMMEKGF